MNPRGFAARVASIATLKDDTRRRLYLHVVSQVEPVGRDETAQALGIGRTLAAFHLDRLVDAGLLDVEFRPLTEQRARGGGRPAKLYRRSSRALEIALPERRYSLAGRLLARAMTEADPTGKMLGRVARQHGVELADAVRQRATEEGSTAEALLGVLTDHGFEPHQEGESEIVLRNCPFRDLAEEHVELICGMNLEVIRTLISELPDMVLEARLDPRPPSCCVRMVQAGAG